MCMSDLPSSLCPGLGGEVIVRGEVILREGGEAYISTLFLQTINNYCPDVN